jgi:hypothetical protein
VRREEIERTWRAQEWRCREEVQRRSERREGERPVDRNVERAQRPPRGAQSRAAPAKANGPMRARGGGREDALSSSFNNCVRKSPRCVPRCASCVPDRALGRERFAATRTDPATARFAATETDPATARFAVTATGPSPTPCAAMATAPGKAKFAAMATGRASQIVPATATDRRKVRATESARNPRRAARSSPKQARSWKFRWFRRRNQDRSVLAIIWGDKYLGRVHVLKSQR